MYKDRKASIEPMTRSLLVQCACSGWRQRQVRFPLVTFIVVELSLFTELVV